MAATSNTPSRQITTKNEVPPKLSPVTIVDSNVAQLYAHVHPFLVTFGYYSQLPNIISSPVSALAASLLLLAAFQAIYTVLCLPVAGSQHRSNVGKPSTKRKGQGKAQGDRISAKVVPFLISLLLATIVGTPLIAILLVLFGAPFTTHIPHTILCAAHISLLAGPPLIYVHGVDSEKWRQIGAMVLPADEVYGAVVGTLFGAWVGAIPIPLDWDREWQKWPITIVTGAYGGWMVGKILGGSVIRGKSIQS